ncbi:hypothetical protein CK203_110723 [Vitis vinifera]|uniref:Uncharacterized protein n=1 Tax=Vitis vinifera TaxID=29760 RepID=A0A438CDY0_VITVI|nr:hypothetical protein CK203_110723 [Vitis vinifera]
MAHIRGGHTDPLLSREPRPRASLHGIQHLRPQLFHILRVECPLALLSAYTQHGDHQLLYPPDSSTHRTKAKRVKTSSLGESSRHSQSNPWAPTDSQHPSDISPKAIIKRPMSELWDSFRLLRRRPGVLHPFTLALMGGRGILEARHVVEVLHILYEPVDPTHFREWSPVSQWDMVHILSKRTFGDSVLLLALSHIGAYGLSYELHLEHPHHCRKRFTLDKWTQLARYLAPLGAPPRPTPPVPP